MSEEEILRNQSRLIIRRGSDPSSLRSASMRSDQSMDYSYNFGNKDYHIFPSLFVSRPSDRSVSMRSDQSMDYSYNFREKDPHAVPRNSGRSDRSVSMRSDQSMDYAYNFGKREPDLVLRGADPSSLRSVSMRSNRSMDYPYNFGKRDSYIGPSIQLKKTKVSVGKNVDFIFKEVEHMVISMVKNKLKIFKKLLNSDFPAFSENMEEDEGDESCVTQEVLNMTLKVLRKLNKTSLAKTLQSKMTCTYEWKHKYNLKKSNEKINEGITMEGTSILLNEIYTELYITEGGSGEVNDEHEVRQIETASRRPATQETPIKCNELFKDKAIRSVLTKGVAGIGKTVSVQKFILNWADGKANQDVNFIFPLPFRELNLMLNQNLSLTGLLHCFFPELNEVRLTDNHYKMLFVFDGLDECRLPLDFQKNESLFDVTQSASVDVLLTNLIKGNLLPSALIWITTRPAATNQIPPECVDQVTEVRGFSDDQKEEYFRKRISDQSLANKIITHIKSSRSLYIMCHIPVFCWIAATVLETVFAEAESGEIPKTLTQMFTHFLIFQIKHKSQKYHGKCEFDSKETEKIILALGKLAFQQLEKGNLIFYEEELRECDIDVREVSLYSGVCTQIFREEFGLHLGKVFSFVHLSVQEFLAALYVFLSFLTSKRKAFEKEIPGFVSSIKKPTMSDLLKSAIDKALQSENGHLDLFLRFLLGLSLKSNQTLLQGLMPQTGSSSHNEDAMKYIKRKIKENPSQEKSINLFHCLNELNDHSLEEEVQKFLSRKGLNRLSTQSNSKHVTDVSLSPAQWSAVVFVLLSSEVNLVEFNLSKYDPSEECFLKLLPVVKASTKANLSGCNLGEKSCAVLAAALISTSSSLRELDLSINNVQDTGVKLLSDGLEHPHCKLEILRLCGCSLTERACTTLSIVLESNTSNLKELNLANNNLQDSGIIKLCLGLQSSLCKLEKLGMENCSITAEGFAALSSAVKSNPTHLRELCLNMNKPGDTGVKMLCEFLKDPTCNLEKLELSDCSITAEACADLASALRVNPSHLKELDISYNNPEASGVKLLSDLLEDPQCKLGKLHFYT